MFDFIIIKIVGLYYRDLQRKCFTKKIHSLYLDESFFFLYQQEKNGTVINLKKKIP